MYVPYVCTTSSLQHDVCTTASSMYYVCIKHVCSTRKINAICASDLTLTLTLTLTPISHLIGLSWAWASTACSDTAHPQTNRDTQIEILYDGESTVDGNSREK
jgi:hypothetical protein